MLPGFISLDDFKNLKSLVPLILDLDTGKIKNMIITPKDNGIKITLWTMNKDYKDELLGRYEVKKYSKTTNGFYILSIWVPYND